jgi:prepilin-type N-terminal cleavage/methylation domain-containing protein
MKTHKRQRAHHRAFTLIELLVVIAIIAMLMSILLPSLGNARKTAWTVICQSHLQQLGMAVQLYLDDQKDPQFLNLQNPAAQLYYVGVVDTLQPYLGDSGSKPFDCPAAKGLSSVRDPTNIIYLQTAGSPRVYTLPFPAFTQLNQPVTEYTEYWFNDSQIDYLNPPSTQFYPSGVSNRKIRLIRNPQWVVWAMDALDEFPRHEGKGNAGRSNAGKDNLLFGDQSIKLLSYEDYNEPTSKDPAGADGPFYNWGHFYHR